MDANLPERFTTYTDAQLFEVVLNKEAYRMEAVAAALEEVKRRGKADELARLIEGHLEAKGEQEKSAGTAEAWHRINPAYSVSLYPGSLQQIQFERILLEHQIPYRLQDTNNFSIPVARYLFTEEDFPKVQELYESLSTKGPSSSPSEPPASFSDLLAEINKSKFYLLAIFLFVLLAILLALL